ncbi:MULTISPECIES: hypothetical protein [Streptosporangium]|uniref:Flagellar associated protein n=1 Tax=Streptosporangium brasiliense TaxID=47480 RepID=A0ABT9RNI8_9ACTN|nr:hypothetical protein [Streptosporangium brasiliense]MDP9870412.1 hypothetical protein [Streptosporangium brasiliense]
MANWSYLPPVDQPGAPVTAGGGGGAGTGFRDLMDARRSGRVPGVPSAQYPDGYLGTVNSRREDRLLDAIKTKTNDRSYQRGVHKGEKTEASDYFWTKEFGPQSGLQAQAQGRRWTAKGSDIERLAHGGKHAFTSPEELGRLAAKYGVSAYDPAARRETDPNFAAQMRGHLPTWK